MSVIALALSYAVIVQAIDIREPVPALEQRSTFTARCRFGSLVINVVRAPEPEIIVTVGGRPVTGPEFDRFAQVFSRPAIYRMATGCDEQANVFVLDVLTMHGGTTGPIFEGGRTLIGSRGVIRSYDRYPISEDRFWLMLR